VDYPSLEKELLIVRARVPAMAPRLAHDVAAFVQAVRREKLAKPPGVAETLDWAQALVALDSPALDDEVVQETLGCFLKNESDVRQIGDEVASRGVAAIVTAGVGATSPPTPADD
jgi:MoxR-like ATPase